VISRSRWRSAVLWASETVLGVSDRGVPQLTNLLDINTYCRFSACRFSRSQYVRVRCAEVLSLFCHLLLIYCCIVFIWLSTQTKRKLWRLVSLASGREPS